MSALEAVDALFVTPYYRPELIGSGAYCGDIAEWLAANGTRISVFTTRPHYPGNEVFPDYRDGNRDREFHAGVDIERVNPFVSPDSSAGRRMMSEGLFMLQGIGAMATGRVRRRPLVLSLCPSILAVLLGVLTTRRDGHHVAIVHDIQSGIASGLSMVGNSRLIELMRWLERSVLNRADLVIVLSEEMRRQLEALGVSTSIKVVPIWVDTARIRPMPAPANGQLTAMYSGNLGRKQALSQVIALAAALRDRQARVRIVLRGQGNQIDALIQEAAGKGLDNVEFLPLLPADQLNQGLAEGDIHLVPQNPDAADFAVPSKVFAIMAAGRPFVATARDGSQLKKLQEESKAFICVPPDDPEAFADAVLRLAEDASLREEIGAQGRRYVVENHSREKVLGDLSDTIRRLQ